MSVRQAQLQISSTEFAEWQAYASLEPFGEERADLRSAIVACVIANANRGKKQRTFKIKDFMPEFGPKKQKTWEQMKSVFKSFSKFHNAQQEKKRG